MKFSYYIVVIILLLPNYLAANFTISGIVADVNKKPINDVVVKIDGNKSEAKTNAKGEFRISSKDSSAFLTLSKKGYRTAKIKVNPYLNENYYIIMMGARKDDAEVVIRGGRGRDLVPDAPKSERLMLRSHIDAAEIGIVQPSSVTDALFVSSDEGRAGVLTAGEVNDFSKWKLWQDISDGELSGFVEEWSVKPLERFTVQIESADRTPIVNAIVKLLHSGNVIWEARTDNTGKAELWANAFTSQDSFTSNFTIKAEYNGRSYSLNQVKEFHEGINFLKFNESCKFTYNLDIAFVVDATGSMGDEIDYLKAELTDIIQKVKDSVAHLDIRLSSLFYRDLYDDYLTKHKDFTENIDDMVNFIEANRAAGGGDTPEAVDAALEMAINRLSWRDDALARIVFLVLDAPPHNSEESIKSLEKSIKLAASKGIRIVPLACSGVDKSTEYIMRSIALLTNGTYLFLTDDSGIGSGHIKPTTDEYTVKLLNSLLFRTIYQFTYLPECQPEPIVSPDTLVVFHPDSVRKPIKGIIPSDEDIFSQDKPFGKDDTYFGWKYYPNPTTGILKIEFQGDVKELFICDVAGKIIYRISNTKERFIEVNLTDYPNGMYFIKYEYEPNKWASGKFLISR